MAEPSWEGMLHISKSQLQTYLQCSQRYRYQYVLATPWEAVPATMVFGRAMHRAVGPLLPAHPNEPGRDTRGAGGTLPRELGRGAGTASPPFHQGCDGGGERRRHGSCSIAS